MVLPTGPAPGGGKHASPASSASAPASSADGGRMPVQNGQGRHAAPMPHHAETKAVPDTTVPDVASEQTQPVQRAPMPERKPLAAATGADSPAKADKTADPARQESSPQKMPSTTSQPGQRPERLLKANPPRQLRGTPPSRQRQTPPSRLLKPPLLLPILMLPHSLPQPVRGILHPHQRHTLLQVSPPPLHHQEDHPPPAADHPPARSPEAGRSGAVPTIWRSRRSPACLRPCATVWREELVPQGTL